MACTNISTIYNLPTCISAAAGVKTFYIANFTADTATWTYDADGQITGGTGNPSFYLVELLEGTASAFEEGVFNAQYRNYSINANVEVVLVGQTQENRNLANSLLGGSYSVIVRGEDGNYYLFGDDKGLRANAATGNFGVQAGDENTIRVTLSASQNEFAPTIDINGTYANTLLITS